MNRPKVITITALKGGTGKTLITFNIVALLAQKYNKRVLVIDLDPQHNMSNLLYGNVKRKTFALPPSIKSQKTRDQFEKDRHFTSEDVFENGTSAMGVIKESHIKNIDVIPTTITMTATELKISGMAGRELILKNWLFDNQEYLADYDYVFFDTNPTMSIVNTNAFITCDSIILVSDIDADGINAVHTFLELYYPMQKRIDRQMEDNIKGLIINKIKQGPILDKDFLSWIESDEFIFGDLLLETKIHDATALSKTKITRNHVVKDSSNTRSYEEMISLIDELTERRIL